MSKQARSDVARAREFWGTLSRSERWDLGDAFVLEGGRGYLVECYELPRASLTGAFMAEIDELLMVWEIMLPD